METRRPWYVVFGRRRWLWGVLAALSAVLVYFLGDIRLSFQLDGVQRKIRDHEFHAAIDLLSQWKARGRSSARWHYLEACARRRAGEPAGVAEALDRAAELNWDRTDIERQRLLLKVQSGLVRSLEPELAKVTQANPDDDLAEEVYEAMARGYLTILNSKEAIKCLESWSKWQPANEIPYLWMADLQELQNSHATAIAYYRKVLAIKPDHLEARLKLGRSLSMSLQLEEAEAEFETCVAVAPDDGDALLSLAEIKRRRGDLAQTKLLLHEALMQDLVFDRQAFALAELGQIALEQRQYPQAVVLLTHSVQINPALISSRQALASALATVGQNELAETHRKVLGELRDRKAQLDKALQIAQQEPNNAAARLTAGLIYIDQGRLSDAEEWLNAAIRVDPKNRAAHEGMARYYQQMGDQNRAQQHLQIAEKLPRPAAAPGQ